MSLSGLVSGSGVFIGNTVFELVGLRGVFGLLVRGLMVSGGGSAVGFRGGFVRLRDRFVAGFGGRLIDHRGLIRVGLIRVGHGHGHTDKSGENKAL